MFVDAEGTNGFSVFKEVEEIGEGLKESVLGGDTIADASWRLIKDEDAGREEENLREVRVFISSKSTCREM